ncbi:MAG: tRNA uridine-5-carboxymethylaminomethyl(34) synthesis enzyme MnmG [Bacteroidales bacterium]
MLINYDIIVIGGGHAGCEAAAAASKLGSNVLLITMDLNKLAQMSCNPAIGGIAKGQIVREIDALGGYTGIVTDKSTIQFRMLNKSKGAAVWSPRAQCDRVVYSMEWREILESFHNLYFWQDSVMELIVDEKNQKKIIGVKTVLGVSFFSKAVILTTGTFLNGKMYVGSNTTIGGRAGDMASFGLTEQLKSLGVSYGRMKTGTPVRLDGRSINFAEMEEQKGDENPSKFSFSDRTTPVQNQMSCYITHTNQEVHDILKEGFLESPLFSGKIKGTGPRYCPSIEDKLRTFSDKISHHLFVEPEGRNISEFYLNGFSSSLPFEVQQKALKKIKGLENAQIIRSGYAVEYDYFPPTQLTHTLSSKILDGVYFAGQVNGTTGYEEAAAQGLVAGINAHFAVQNKQKEFILARNQAYIGVLIDDLVVKGVDEPYRMFTSRAEFRVFLRQDNADVRLFDIAMSFGLLLDNEKKRVFEKINTLEFALSFLNKTKVAPEDINSLLEKKGTKVITQKKSLFDLLLRPEISLSDFSLLDDFVGFFKGLSESFLLLLESEVKYFGYKKKESLESEKMVRLSELVIPSGFDFSLLASLSTEAKQKMFNHKPKTIAEAMMLPGVSPADISALLVCFGR